MAGKIQKSNPKYWLEQGYSKEDAEIEAKKYKGYTSTFHPNYYLFRGIVSTEEEAIELAKKATKEKCGATIEKRLQRFDNDEEKYNDWVKNTCILTKENMLKNMTEDEYTEFKISQGLGLKGKRYSELEYWVNLGYSEEDAKQKTSEFGRNTSPRCIEYWMNKGYSEEDAIDKVSEYQDMSSLKSLQKKYGETEGAKKYKEYSDARRLLSKRCVEYWIQLGYTELESIELGSKHQYEVSSKGPHLIQYWLDKGYSEEEAENFRYEYCLKKFVGSKYYWLDKGYSEEEAQKISRKHQSEFGKRGILCQVGKFHSKLEKHFDKMTLHIENKKITSAVKRDNGRYFFADFEFDNCFVELYGDYWHGNPKIYGPEAVIGDYKIAKDKWKADEERIKEIEEATNKKVIIIWESEFKDNPNKIKEIISTL